MIDSPQRLVFPVRTREDYAYLPISFVDTDVVLGDDMLAVPGAGPYMFGVLSSSVHRAWADTVGTFEDGMLVYDPSMVYNNCPWPETDGVPVLREAVEKTADGILLAREAHPDLALDKLYDEATMPDELRAAHEKNDAAVLAAYGLPPSASDMDILSLLFTRYAELVGKDPTESLRWLEAHRPFRRRPIRRRH